MEKKNTTFYMDTTLVAWLRQRAAFESRTITHIVERALRAERTRCEDAAAEADPERMHDDKWTVVRQE